MLTPTYQNLKKVVMPNTPRPTAADVVSLAAQNLVTITTTMMTNKAWCKKAKVAVHMSYGDFLGSLKPDNYSKVAASARAFQNIWIPYKAYCLDRVRSLSIFWRKYVEQAVTFLF